MDIFHGLTDNDVYPVVSFNSSDDKVAALDLSERNTTFTREIFTDISLFNSYIEECRKNQNARYLIGGYNENRKMYTRSELFDTNDEPRSLHLGIDIWGEAGTPVYCPLDGTVHSFKFNDNYGDYGATIILEHRLHNTPFYMLYGHLALKDITSLTVGEFIHKGQQFASFGDVEENGHWPAHLHFQCILDIGNWQGDYPGVCKPSESNKYLNNSPNPSTFLKFLVNHHRN